MRTCYLSCLVHLCLELVDLPVVAREAVGDGALEVVNGHKVREEGQDVLNLQQATCRQNTQVKY